MQHALVFVKTHWGLFCPQSWSHGNVRADGQLSDGSYLSHALTATEVLFLFSGCGSQRSTDSGCLWSQRSSAVGDKSWRFNSWVTLATTWLSHTLLSLICQVGIAMIWIVSPKSLCVKSLEGLWSCTGWGSGLSGHWACAPQGTVGSQSLSPSLCFQARDGSGWCCHAPTMMCCPCTGPKPRGCLVVDYKIQIREPKWIPCLSMLRALGISW